MSRVLSIAEAVERNVRDGDTVAMEGFTLRDLHVRTRRAHGEAA